MAELRQAVGLRNLASVATAAKMDKAKTALPSFKQYREDDGRFYFKFGTSVSYGAFLSVLGFAVWVRHHLLAGQRR
jgi:hypothetical protein